MHNEKPKGDLRIDRTQNLLRRAMLELLRQMSFEEITVKLLAQQATINRKTFYAHYSGKEQLLEEMFREADEALCGCLVYQKPMPDAQPDREQMEAALRRYLSTVVKIREYLETLYTDSTTAIGMRVLDEVIQQGHSCLFLTPDSRGRLPVRLWHGKIVTFSLHLGLVAGPAGLHGGGGRSAAVPVPCWSAKPGSFGMCVPGKNARHKEQADNK